MPNQTPRYAFPYPVPGDPITDGAAMIQQLAEAVEARIYAGAGNPDPTPPPASLIGVYAVDNLVTQSVSGNQLVILGSVTIPNPGVQYRINPYAQFEAGHFNAEAAKPVVYVRVGSINGLEVGRGIGDNRSDWGTIAVTPTNANVFTGSQTVYYVAASALGTGRLVTVSDYLAKATVHVHAA